MTRTDAAASNRHSGWRIGAVLATVLVIVAGAGWYWRVPPTGVQSARPAASAVTVKPADYRMPGSEVSGRNIFPPGAAAISGADIVAALSDHTAMLPGGFVEYYAPDGTLHGMAEEKHYGGSWEVRDGDFCTKLEGGDSSVCSPVEREGSTLYWSLDGEPEASPVTTMPGNPDNLR